MLIDPYHWQTVRITELIRESADAITLVTERPAKYSFAPGQHAIVRVILDDGSTRLRQYSFAHSPDTHSLHFTITRSLGGDVSNWSIDRASTKSVLDISQPFTGPLHNDLSNYRHIGMIGGGSGIAPLMSHLRLLRDQNAEQTVSVLYSTRSSQRCYDNELVSLNEHESIIVRLTDSSPRFAHDEIVEAMKDCDMIMVCGSREFVMDIQKQLHAAYPTAEQRYEAFSLQ
jgi:ferredoxin-NADP reductase